MTPPQELDTMQRQENATKTMIAPLEKSDRRLSLPPSPPLHPAPLDTAMPSKSLPQAFPHPPVDEPWTRQDDQILINHVFSSFSDADWSAIVQKLQGRHDAFICRDRWRKLQAAMLDDLDQQ
jgi:Myb-like DNA-binding domain